MNKSLSPTFELFGELCAQIAARELNARNSMEGGRPTLTFPTQRDALKFYNTLPAEQARHIRPGGIRLTVAAHH